MNVLILTPDAVGSTLLQRTLTIYMAMQQFDRPVINLHELTNGLAKYYSPEFNQEIVSKKFLSNWGYHQTLQQIVEILSSVNHYKTSRLAHYHIRQRGDSIDQQIPFYNYLNENFYIIACRRANVFEHALSMTLNKITKKLNVYSPDEKIDAFYEIYKSGVNLDPEVFVKQLDAYKLYIDWSSQYFNISSYFNYEQDVPRLEQYILNLPVFVGQKNLTTWDKNFGISFNNWNKLHYIRSDVNQLLPNATEQTLIPDSSTLHEYQQTAPSDWPSVQTINDMRNLPEEIKHKWTKQIISKDGIIPLLNKETQNMLMPFKEGYNLAQRTIDQMVDLGIIISGPPIKKQTLLEKSKIIKNYEELRDLYNRWIEKNPELATPDSSFNNINDESKFWSLLPTQDEVRSLRLPI